MLLNAIWNPLDAMRICLNKQKLLMYKVFVPSVLTVMDLWKLWTHLSVRGWLSLSFHFH